MQVRIATKGIPAHSGTPELGRSAIWPLLDWVQKLPSGGLRQWAHSSEIPPFQGGGEATSHSAGTPPSAGRCPHLRANAGAGEKSTGRKDHVG